MRGEDGNLLDGDWPGGAGGAGGAGAYPSGDGAAGGDFLFRLNVLPGDGDGNGLVSSVDTIELRRRRAHTAANPGTPGSATAYSPFYDANADGRHDDADLRVIRTNLLRRLPGGEPAPAAPQPAPAAAGAPVSATSYRLSVLAARRSATREVFAEEAILP